MEAPPTYSSGAQKPWGCQGLSKPGSCLSPAQGGLRTPRRQHGPLTCSLPLQSFQVPCRSQPPGQRVESRQSKLARSGLAFWLRHLLAVPPPSGLSSPICDLADNTRRAVCQLGAWHAVNTRERKAPPVRPAALRSLPTALNTCPGRCFYCFMCLCPQLDHHLP